MQQSLFSSLSDELSELDMSASAGATKTCPPNESAQAPFSDPIKHHYVLMVVGVTHLSLKTAPGVGLSQSTQSQRGSGTSDCFAVSGGVEPLRTTLGNCLHVGKSC